MNSIYLFIYLVSVAIYTVFGILNSNANVSSNNRQQQQASMMWRFEFLVFSRLRLFAYTCCGTHNVLGLKRSAIASTTTLNTIKGYPY